MKITHAPARTQRPHGPTWKKFSGLYTDCIQSLYTICIQKCSYTNCIQFEYNPERILTKCKIVYRLYIILHFVKKQQFRFEIEIIHFLYDGFYMTGLIMSKQIILQ